MMTRPPTMVARDGISPSMANPMALTYANDTIDGDTPSISYATVYPLGMFVRVIIAQVLIMFFV